MTDKWFKKIALTAIALMMGMTAMASCQGLDGNTSISSITDGQGNDSPDRRAFGVTGPVAEVNTVTYEATKGSNALVRGELLEDRVSRMVFDDEGRVVEDSYGNLYVYDAEGNFTRGVEAYTRMKRDEQGRIIAYENSKDDEDDMSFFYKFTYDAKGRFSHVTIQLWEGTFDETITYQGDNIFPEKIVSEGDEEGDKYSATTTYKYLRTDEHGNWTEREVHIHTVTTSDEGLGSSSQEISDSYTIEVREIKYL